MATLRYWSKRSGKPLAKPCGGGNAPLYTDDDDCCCVEESSSSSSSVSSESSPSSPSESSPSSSESSPSSPSSSESSPSSSSSPSESSPSESSPIESSSPSSSSESSPVESSPSSPSESSSSSSSPSDSGGSPPTPSDSSSSSEPCHECCNRYRWRIQDDGEWNVWSDETEPPKYLLPLTDDRCVDEGESCGSYGYPNKGLSTSNGLNLTWRSGSASWELGFFDGSWVKIATVDPLFPLDPEMAPKDGVYEAPVSFYYEYIEIECVADSSSGSSSS